ncbi:wax ester/triacylglycerol synthase family O-acyltransferase [Streptosporangium sp. NBC_01755]|uniref:WS/DGAT/MGAT family O-acyltransferase n=1 Tax=unclassified Streptosporangium TaxID=2632669 RepID=UPI002DDACF0E|nr:MULTISPECIES: wax ester/triacylglycerol synthase family O-acyltransferase [unclassified Streptosporangium]WSA28941.1 wax ester/triacylglycerol synthase family O-acyltransferase [Streptosporangium sp. NBC_01810]WSC99612.1 wax ester/triacylglycerol synthase family O-acyltransferase [Streptosporangium sp. NBC_01755]
MRQLSAVDTQFLNFETSTNVANIGGLAILSGRLSRSDLVSLLARRLHLAAPFRMRLVSVPFGLDHPYWTEDSRIDLDYHVREIALPAPGSDEQLGEQVARLHARCLDRRRPLWEMYLIHGLAGDRTALYTKVHHAAVDGVTGADVLASLLDTSPEPAEVEMAPAAEPEERIDTREMVARGIAKAVVNPANTVRFLINAVPHLDEIPLISQVPGAGLVSRVTRQLANRLSGTAEVPAMPRMTVPRTPFSGRISAHRRFAYAALPLEDVKLVKNALGVTVNDVVMALCAGALRQWLLKHDALPEQPLVAGVPFSLRVPGDRRVGNQVTIMITTLATQVADPLERLLAVRDAMRLIKDRSSLAPVSWIQELSDIMPSALTGLASRAAFNLFADSAGPINVMISNVPGPQLPLYVSGARLLSYHPVSVVTDASGGLNITVFSYDGSLDVGVIACREMVPDVWAVTDYLRDALLELKLLVEEQ